MLCMLKGLTVLAHVHLSKLPETIACCASIPQCSSTSPDRVDSCHLISPKQLCIPTTSTVVPYKEDETSACYVVMLLHDQDKWTNRAEMLVVCVNKLSLELSSGNTRHSMEWIAYWIRFTTAPSGYLPCSNGESAPRTCFGETCCGHSLVFVQATACRQCALGRAESADICVTSL